MPIECGAVKEELGLEMEGKRWKVGSGGKETMINKGKVSRVWMTL